MVEDNFAPYANQVTPEVRGGGFPQPGLTYRVRTPLGPYFLLPSNRRSIRKRLTKSRYKVSAPRIARLASASPYPDVSAICFSFQVS
ncbi:MAG: hypothetical protein HW377_2835 [Actinobacteria bacterium]|nr:hypothetical protein [Actinomycetota bacterium]